MQGCPVADESVDAPRKLAADRFERFDREDRRWPHVTGPPISGSLTYDRCVFGTSERDDLRDRLIAAARDDERITAAAIVGSGARGAEDAWSDIDLALRLSERLEPHDVAGDWTTKMYECAGAVDHFDVWSGTTLYRVFLLANTLQVDVSFWMSDTFAAVG
jgi:predicted nucleotidyltransferase